MKKHQLLSIIGGFPLLITIRERSILILFLFATSIFTLANVHAQLDEAQEEAEEICNSYEDATWKNGECIFENTPEGKASKETYGDECESTSFAKKYPNYCRERNG